MKAQKAGFKATILAPLALLVLTVGFFSGYWSHAELDEGREVIFFGSHAMALGAGLFGIFYLLTWRAEKRLALSQAELSKSEARFRSLVESSSDLVWEVDARGTYTYVSPKVRDLLGYTPEEVIGRTPFDLMLPDEAVRLRAWFKDIVASRQPMYGVENANRHKDGRVVVLETNAVPFFHASGALAGYRGMDRDVTARKQVETALRQSQQNITETQRIASQGSRD